MNNILSQPSQLLASAAHTTSSVTSGLGMDGADMAWIFVKVTAKSGTNPTIQFIAETTGDLDNENADWVEVDRFPSVITDTGNYMLAVSKTKGFCRFLRCRYNISGASASFTFSLQIVRDNN